VNAQVQQSYFRSTGMNDDWIGLVSNQSAIDPLAYAIVPPAADGFASAYPFSSFGGASPQQGGIMAQMMQMLQSLMGMMQQFFSGSSGAPGFGSATISSTGDPHVAIDGSLNGSNVSLKYDNMQSDPNFVRSDSFTGGYAVATQTTAPGANGVTFNQCATVTTNFGQTRVSFDKDGNAAILQNGNAIAIGAGQTVDLGSGESVTDNGNSLVVNDTNGYGGNITTTMTQNGNGVDVSVNAQNVNLGGDVVRKALGRTTNV
jgi:hypothetical protein